MKTLPSLARQNARLLAFVFLLVELLVAAALAYFMMLPLARRSADDLAGLMILAAQTWAELPPATRPDFEYELFDSHQLALRAESPELPGPGRDEWHPPYFYLLEDALARRTGEVRHLVRERVGETHWYWTSLPAGAGRLAVGLAESRIAARPGTAVLAILAGGLVLALAAAYGLARRITAPLARLDEAAAAVGQGARPALLPETGPRELASLARRFNAMAQQVQSLLTARTTLLAGVSHDLRTPLARMRLALEMLKADPAPALIARLESDIDEMNGLIATLLDLARGLEHEPHVDTDLARMLASLAAESPRIHPQSPPCRRMVPPRALHRALGNLLQNALRYAPEGFIDLVCEPMPDGCRIGILDRGPGIPAERIAAMFEPFQRLDASRSPQTGGAGLGLAIVRELARANGWQVSLEPREGGGLAAWIVLPRAPD
ncbi:MAG: ATP-binding protein [Rhodocyclaceae bacterium]|jgi:two-component system osmolarity sensor histidine kinase EnvZ|nr:ATP-binding protein [Rhodocyclaceae bacterium]